MATYYWVGGTGVWDGVTNTHWALTSGGTGGLVGPPTLADNAIHDGNSGGGTITFVGDPICKDWTSTAFTGTFSGTGSPEVHGNIVFGAGVTLSNQIQPIINGGVTQNVTMNGATTTTFGGFEIGSGTLSQQDDIYIPLNVGGIFSTDTWNSNGHNITGAGEIILTSGSANLASSSITCGVWSVTGAAVTPPTTLTCTSLSGGSSYNDVNINFTTSQTLSGLTIGGNLIANTSTTALALTLSNTTVSGNFNSTFSNSGGSIIINASVAISGNINLAGSSVLNRLLIASGTPGTSRTLAPINFTLTNCDLRDITNSASGVVTTTSLGNCGRNSGFSFPAQQTYYAVTSGSTPAFLSLIYAASSGGTPTANYPLPQDQVYFDANSFPSGGATLTMAGYTLMRLPAIDFTGVTNSPILSLNNTCNLYGNVKLNSGVTYTGSFAWGNDGDQTVMIETGGSTFPAALQPRGVNGTLTFSGAFLSSAAITHTQGILDLSTFSVQAAGLTSNAGGTTVGKRLIRNSGSFTATGTTPWNVSVTNLTYVPGAGQINITSGTTTTFTGAGFTYNTINVAAVNTTTINGSNFINTILGTPGCTIKFAAGTTNTVDGLPSGISGSNITITSSTTSAFTLASPGRIISCDYITLSHSTASPASTFYAGTHSTNSGSNTNWTFTAPPAVTKTSNMTALSVFG